MKLYVGVSLFDEEIGEPKALWDECTEVGCEGLVVGMRDAQTLASHILDPVSFTDQRKMLRRLADARPSELSLIPGPHDVASMEFLSGIPMQAIWLPPVASHRPDLVRAAAAMGVPVLAAVNGLGPRGLEALLKACDGAPTTLCYLAAKGEKISSMLMQLAWLHAQRYPVGLVADDEVELQSAAALGAEVLVASRTRVLKEDWQGVAVRLRRIAEAARGNGSRPITREQMDGLGEEVPLLVATRRLEPGELVTKEDIAVRVIRRRGLAPFMLETVVGRRLRYGLDSGEPFSFGYLKEPEGHD